MVSDYLTPGGSPVPGMEGRRAIHISSERERIARQMAQDALDQAAGLAERDNALISGKLPRLTSAVVAAKVIDERMQARKRRERIIFVAGFLLGIVLGAAISATYVVVALHSF